MFSTGIACLFIDPGEEDQQKAETKAKEKLGSETDLKYVGKK